MQDVSDIRDVLRAFRRHYHKVRKAYASLVGKGSFQLRIKYDGSVLKSETSTPDDGETTRFVVLMHGFVDQSSPIHYQVVWDALQEHFGDLIPTEATEGIGVLVKELSQGTLRINANGRDLSAEDIYNVMSRGEFFGRDEDARKYLESLAEGPSAGPLIWHEFYMYSLKAFELVSAIFDVIKRLEETSAYQFLFDEPTGNENVCIYCLTTTNTFTSEEHVFPESLGNDELILPKGYVCDQCNNGILARLDEALLEFGPIALLQVQMVTYTKSGQFPKANFQNLYIERRGPREIAIRAKDRTGKLRAAEDLGDGWQIYNLEMSGKIFDPVLLGRALYKIGLGLVALGPGANHARSPKYDAVRAFVQQGVGFPNNLLMHTEFKPTSQVRTALQHESEGSQIVIDVFGLIFFLNLESHPILELTEDLAQHHFRAYPLSDQ